MSDEKSVLVGSLTYQRDHVRGIVDGLSEEQLRRVMVPSGWSCLAIIKHLALDVEHYWFRCIWGGESLEFFGSGVAGERDGWHVDASTSVQQIFDLYDAEIQTANEVIEQLALDATPQQRDAWWAEWDPGDLRSGLLHVIAETACHAGHLDIARELIDGRQWLAGI